MRCPWPLVAVYWQDAFDAENGWCDVPDYKPQPCYVVSIGFLWPECLDGYVTITASYMPDEVPELKSVGMPTHIPVAMVKHVVTLDQPEFPDLQ
jgi:hypothetical protein